jgi:hypothetical protein
MINNDSITDYSIKNNRWLRDPKEPTGNTYYANHTNEVLS